jgi:hypothetical protein
MFLPAYPSFMPYWRIPDINIGFFLTRNPYFIYRGAHWTNWNLRTFIIEYRIYLVFPGCARFRAQVKKRCFMNYGTIFEIGISRISSAPHCLSFGISPLTALFCTTVWTL